MGSEKVGWSQIQWLSCLVHGITVTLVLASASLAAMPTRDALHAAIADDPTLSPRFSSELTAFYQEHDNHPLWFGSALADTRRTQLLLELGQAASEGLNPADYLSEPLRQACGSPERYSESCELRLSDSLLRYASEVGFGRLQATEVDPHWHIPQQHLPARKLLDAIAGGADFPTLLQRLEPPHEQYRALRSELAHYRDIRPRSPWLSIQDGSSLHPGDSGDRVLVLRERLGAEQPELLGAEVPDLFDSLLQQAVKRFQAQHGLDEDGIVGAQTLAALNTSLNERIQQIEINMERWRWLPRDLGQRYVMVNLAGFSLSVVRPGHAPQAFRVISGRPDRSSPVFESDINRLIVNPHWTVPRRIAVEDLLPKLRQDPHALQSKDIQVLQRDGTQLVAIDPAGIDWRHYNKNNFPFVLRQAPGPHNSLGRLKFVMPNTFDIYIHDTPQKNLFSKSRRTFSSGCVRVEHPLQLAAALLGGPTEATVAALQARIDVGETGSLQVSPSVPVYLVYLTAWVDSAGNLQLRNDVYGRDVQMRDWFSVL